MADVNVFAGGSALSEKSGFVNSIVGGSALSDNLGLLTTQASAPPVSLVTPTVETMSATSKISPFSSGSGEPMSGSSSKLSSIRTMSNTSGRSLIADDLPGGPRACTLDTLITKKSTYFGSTLPMALHGGHSVSMYTALGTRATQEDRSLIVTGLAREGDKLPLTFMGVWDGTVGSYVSDRVSQLLLGHTVSVPVSPKVGERAPTKRTIICFAPQSLRSYAPPSPPPPLSHHSHFLKPSPSDPTIQARRNS